MATLRRPAAVCLAALLLGAAARAEPATTPASAPTPDDEDDEEGGRLAPSIEEDEGGPAAARAWLEQDPAFGPLLVIERIDVVGTVYTPPHLVRRALLVREGDALRAGDPRFQASRFRVLALGYFADARLRLLRGARRGEIVLVVEVEERHTLILNHVFLGAAEATPVWAGLDIADANFGGTGTAFGLAFVWAEAASVPGAADQQALRFRYGDPSLLGLPLGTHAEVGFDDASLPVRLSGEDGEGDPALFGALRYLRGGGRAGVSLELGRLSTLLLDGRYESVWAHNRWAGQPGVATTLRDGRSDVVSLRVALDRDRRVDPVLPRGGSRALVAGELGVELLGGDYDFLRLEARYDHWVPVRGRHVLALHLGAGLLLGDPPDFDRFHIGDVSPLATPRPLGLVVATAAPLDLLDSGAGRFTWGDALALAEGEWAYRVIPRSWHVYGGDVFLRAGVLAFGTARHEVDLPLSLLVNAGLRLDTEIGVFELTLGNALGRLPL